jgi:hypothetical protein
VCSHCYGLPLYSFHRFKKRAHFKFWTNPKASVQFFSTDFNLLIFSRFNFKILILQFDFLKPEIIQNLMTINLFPDSGLNFQKIQPDFWFLISLNSISQIHQNQFQVLQILSFWSWLSNWFNQRLPVQNFWIPDFQIQFLDEVQIPDFYFKSRLNVNLTWKNQSHFSRWARLILRIQIFRFLSDSP